MHLQAKVAVPLCRVDLSGDVEIDECQTAMVRAENQREEATSNGISPAEPNAFRILLRTFR